MESPQLLSTSSSVRRRSSANSPEFEFCSFPEPNLHSADELFADGVLLPLHLLHHHPSDDPPDKNSEPEPEPPNTATKTEEELSPAPVVAAEQLLTTTLTASKRWKDIFKKNPQTINKNREEKLEKEKKKERKGGGAASAAELNINLWPFSRSRSAGTGGSRSRVAVSRKVSSAPCSRSNSAGESKSMKWPSSPSRGGVHLGRTSPVWQVKRVGSGRNTVNISDAVSGNAGKGVKKEVNDSRRNKPPAGGGAKAKVLSLNVPTCIGYRQHLSCRNGVNSVVRVGSGKPVVGGEYARGVVSGDGGRGSNLFNIRSLFTKKVY